MSLADIRNKMQSRYNPEQAPPELRMMYGAAADAATQGGDFGPDIWGRIWPHRTCTIPNARGERLKTFEWKLEEGKRGDCCIAEIPAPIATHIVYIGWKETKKGSFFAKERVRCLARRYEPDPRGTSRVVGTGVQCPFCLVLGADRWRAIQIGGVIDMRTDQEPLVGPDGRAIDTPPRMLILDNDAAQQAIVDGLMERHIRGKPTIGTVFHVSRGTGKNTSRVGTNWIPDLDITVPDREIQKIYYPVNMNMAYPILDGKHDTPFEDKEIPEIVHHIIERHVFLCIKYRDKMPGRFLGYDEKGATDFGLEIVKMKEQAKDSAGETEAGHDEPANRGLRIMAETDAGKTGPSLRDLSDKDAPPPPPPPTASAPPAPPAPPAAPAPEEVEVSREDVVKMTKDELVELARDWEIELPKRANDDRRRLAILTSPKGFGLVQAEAEGLLGLIPTGGAPEEAEEAPEEGEDLEEAPEEVDPAKLRAQLLDAKTSIKEVVEAANAYGVEPVKNEKGQVLRAKTVEAIIATIGAGGGAKKRNPWEE